MLQVHQVHALCYTPPKKSSGLELANLLAGTGIYLLAGIAGYHGIQLLFPI